MRRLEARLSDSLNNVSTSIDTAMLSASSRSSSSVGSGISMTKIRPTAAMGMIHSVAPVLRSDLPSDFGSDFGSSFGSGLGLLRDGSSGAGAAIGLWPPRCGLPGGTLSCRNLPGARLGPPDGRQNFRHHGIELGRDRLADFHGAIQRMRQRRVFDNGDAVPARNFLDLGGQQVAPFGN